MTHPGLFFVADGMRQDLIERYAAEGALPTMAAMLRNGVRGRNGVLPPVPTNTGAGWATLATGAWSGRSGAINNLLHLPDDPIHVGRAGFGAELIEAETLVQAAERQGISTLTFEWASAMPARGAGPVVSFWRFYAARGIVTTFTPSGVRADEAGGRGLFCQRVWPIPAHGWRSLPESALPPQCFSIVLHATSPAMSNQPLHVLLTASTTMGYDRLLVATTPDAAQPLVTLGAGEWAHARLPLADGRMARLWLTCIDLSPDLSRVRLYLTTLARHQASPPALEQEIAAWDLPPLVGADYGPFQAGLIDEATFIEQGRLWFAVAAPMLTRLVQRYRPELLLVGTPVIDEMCHQFLARITPSYPGYDATRASHYEAVLRDAYVRTDAFLAHARALMPPDTVTVVSSDHGFGAAWKSVHANRVLAQAGLADVDAAGIVQPGSATAAYGAGGTVNVYINERGRYPGGTVDPAAVASIQRRTIGAFTELRDPANPDAAVLARAVRREDAATFDTGEGPANLLHPTRTGDVVIILHPPYQFDGAHPAAPISDAPLLGQHGYLPDAVDAARSVTMRSAFVMDGPGIPADRELPRARAIDLAPTLAKAMGIAGPKDADGVVLT